MKDLLHQHLMMDTERVFEIPDTSFTLTLLIDQGRIIVYRHCETFIPCIMQRVLFLWLLHFELPFVSQCHFSENISYEHGYGSMPLQVRALIFLVRILM
jgi:hypothetical protein